MDAPTFHGIPLQYIPRLDSADLYPPLRSWMQRSTRCQRKLRANRARARTPKRARTDRELSVPGFWGRANRRTRKNFWRWIATNPTMEWKVQRVTYEPMADPHAHP